MAQRRSLILGALAGATLLAGCDKLGFGAPSSKPAFKGVDVTGPVFTYSLPDQNGKLRTPEDFKGKVTAVFFGYTQCPDVCPTSMAELAQVKKALGTDGDRLQALFITVDPERDTPELLKAYVGNFDPAFLALRGTLDQTKAAAASFKAFFAKVPGKSPDSYTMDHTAGIYLFDFDAKVRVFERYGMDVPSLTADVKALLG
ncbi:SCO family protein [Piscinibacter terrae]|uniref:SCO family protein n=1 Tax=Piscinibacter terrae TaxID=2496871 RepID=A0A3N7HHQ6_9BURK|nr:SCO family protein [Albitalea terrae]RQP21580.1 SCO family protein [Albitalea terrae]